MTAPQRHFLGWHRPALELIAERLLNLHRQDARALRRLVVIVPTRESGRRLREALAAGAPGGALLSPRIMQMQQLLHSDDPAVADSLMAQAAWQAELQEPDIAETFSLLCPESAAEGNATSDRRRDNWRVSLAERLHSLSDRLTGELIEPAQVAALLRGEPEALRKREPADEHARRQLSERIATLNPEEKERWQQLADLTARVEDRLHRWHRLSEREGLARSLSAPTLPPHADALILACLPQLSAGERTLLAQLAHKGLAIESWVHAPESERDSFDAFGQPTEAWLSRIVPLNDEHIHVVTEETGMAEKALQLASGSPSEDILLGVCDTDFLPAVSLRFAEQGWPLYNPGGRSASGLELTSLPHLLDLALEDSHSSAPLEKLLRNSVLQRLLGAGLPERTNRLLDEIMQTQLPAVADSLQGYAERYSREEISQNAASAEAGDQDALGDTEAERSASPQAPAARRPWTQLAAYIRRVRELVESLSRAESAAPALRQLAAALTGISTGNAPYSRLAAAMAEDISELAAAMQEHPQEIEVHTALRIISGRLNAAALQQEQRSDAALDALGWLELPYGAGSQLILTGLHDGIVPEALPDDPFLPDTLRRLLGMSHRSLRLARDSYLLLSLIASHRRTDVIVARLNPQRDPVHPSSLLLRCPAEPPEALTDRIAHLFRPAEAFEAPPLYELGAWRWHHPSDQQEAGSAHTDTSELAAGVTPTNSPASISPASVSPANDSPANTDARPGTAPTVPSPSTPSTAPATPADATASVLGGNTLISSCGQNIPIVRLPRLEGFGADADTDKAISDELPWRSLLPDTWLPEPITLLGSSLSSPWAQPGHSFSPTDIDAFLRSPLLFWLKKLMNINAYDVYEEGLSSMTPLTRGSLLHRVLEKLIGDYRSDAPALSAEEIYRSGKRYLEEEIRQLFGDETPPAVQLFAAFVDAHLRQYAEMHLKDLRDGWSVVACEQKVLWTVAEGISFRMTVDRVDSHRDGRFRVIDYKTGSSYAKKDQSEGLCSLPGGIERYGRLMPFIPTKSDEKGPEKAVISIQLPLYAAWVSEHFSVARSAVETCYDVFTLSEKGVVRIPQPSDAEPDAPRRTRLIIEAAVGMMRAGVCLVSQEDYRGSRPSSQDPLLPFIGNSSLRSLFGLPPLPLTPAATDGDNPPDDSLD